MQLGLPFADVASRQADAAPGTLGPGPATIVFVRHRRARRYVLRVYPDGRVRVTIPRGGSRKDADAFALRHGDWIARERARLARATIPPETVSSLRRRAAAELPVRLEALAAEHGLTVARVSVRNQRTRWGSCGRNGHISLNWRLVLMPEWVRDYVLVHELMHLRRLDHSPQFWRLVAAACPRYREARAWLRAHGPGLRQTVIHHWDAASDGPFSEAALRDKLESEGWSVSRYTYSPGTVFPDHTHAVDKIDAVVRGRFRLVLEDQAHVLGPGDWIEVPRGARHSAAVEGDTAVVSLDAVRRSS